MDSPFRWFGGKGGIADKILAEFPPDSTYNCYVEPFGGGASILFAKPPTCLEIYNDKDQLLTNFFAVLRDKSEELIERLQLTLYSKDQHKQAKLVLHKENLRLMLRDGEDVEAAAMFFILTRQSMSGDIKGGWSLGKSTNPVPVWLNSIERLPECVARFRDVQVENLHAVDLMKKYDGEKVLFYVDPPYHQDVRSSTRYNVDFTSYDQGVLMSRLKHTVGMVILSGYDNKLYNKELDGWGIVEIPVVNQAKPNVGNYKGEGVMKDNDRKVETLWLNPSLMEHKKQLTMF